MFFQLVYQLILLLHQASLLRPRRRLEPLVDRLQRSEQGPRLERLAGSLEHRVQLLIAQARRFGPQVGPGLAGCRRQTLGHGGIT